MWKLWLSYITYMLERPAKQVHKKCQSHCPSSAGSKVTDFKTSLRHVSLACNTYGVYINQLQITDQKH